MEFTWDTPPWLRPDDCTHMATMLVSAGAGQVSVTSEAVRGDDATEALADLLMGPGGRAGAVLLPGMIAVVIRRGVDVMWLAQPPIDVTDLGGGEFGVDVNADGDDISVFPAAEVATLRDQLHAAYGG